MPALAIPRSVATELLTPTEASAILGVTVNTLEVWRCTRRYLLPWVKVGRLVRYRRTDLEAFITSRTVGAPAAVEA